MEEAVDNFKTRSPQAMERAKEIQANLSSEHPSFIKVMQKSSVSHTFNMHLPLEFCQKHIPKTDIMVVLDVENGQSYDAKLLGMERAFGGGWRRLPITEKLLVNDILVFHLVEPCKFKVYIVRASGFAQIDKTPGTVGSYKGSIETKVEKKRTCENDKKRLKFVPVEIPRKNVKASDSSMKKSSNINGSNPNSEKMRGSMDKSWNHSKASSPEAMERAKEIQANLCPKYPSFFKLLLKSYLSRPFCLKLPALFCQKHLQRNDETVVFEVESGRSYDIKLLGKKCLFSGGWKEFFIAEKLVENDILVFHLVEHCKFKVYIVRANKLDLVDKAPTVVKIGDSTTEKTVEEERTVERKRKRLKFDPVNLSEEKLKLSNSLMENSEGYLPSQTFPEFKDFKIVVNGTTIEFPEEVHVDYYKLCHIRKSYLHLKLIKGIKYELAASIISGTVSISNAIRESKISTPREDIAYWDKALDGFEVFGMEVGFMKARVNRLYGLTLDLKKYREAKIEHDRVEKKIIKLEKEKRRLDDEIKRMKEVAEKFEVIYEEEANAPW